MEQLIIKAETRKPMSWSESFDKLYDLFIKYELSSFPQPPGSPPRLLCYYNEKTFRFADELDTFHSPADVRRRIDSLKEKHWRILWTKPISEKQKKR